jgi:hypothetical protein
MLQTGTTYDAELHARNQQKHGSWTLKLLNQSAKFGVDKIYEKEVYNPENNFLVLSVLSRRPLHHRQVGRVLICNPKQPACVQRLR